MPSTILKLVYAAATWLLVGQTLAKPLASKCTTFNDCDGDLICTGGLCSELSTTKMCSWAGHGIGYTCSNDDACSNDLVCSSNHACADQYAKTKPPYVVTAGCWNNTYWVSAPEGCHHGKCPSGWVTVWMLEVKGEHFNVGNAQVQVLSGQSVLSTQSVTAVAGKPGKAAGSFDVKTYVECPKRHHALGIKVIDGCTGKSVLASYPAE